MTAPAKRRTAGSHDAFPLRTVAALTGLTPDLIRAWEKRYAVVAPIRGARGARLYTAADIAHLRVLARVVGAGRAIGDVAHLTHAELERLAAPPALDGPASQARDTVSPREELLARILERLERFDHAAVTRVLGDTLVGLGVRAFVREVVLPLMQRVGTRWVDGTLSIGAEHLVTGLLRNLLAGLMQRRSGSGAPIVLATPAGERHEIGLLVVALLALDAGANVLYLGIDLPAADIATAATETRAPVVGLSVVGSDNRARAIAAVAALQTALPAVTELWVGGADARHVVARVTRFRGLVLSTLEATEAELARIAAVPSQPRRAVGANR